MKWTIIILGIFFFIGIQAQNDVDFIGDNIGASGGVASTNVTDSIYDSETFTTTVKYDFPITNYGIVNLTENKTLLVDSTNAKNGYIWEMICYSTNSFNLDLSKFELERNSLIYDSTKINLMTSKWAGGNPAATGARIMIYAQYNIPSTDITSPDTLTAEIGTYNDSILVITMTEALNSDSIPTIGTFTVTEGVNEFGITSISIISNKIYIALDSVGAADSVFLVDWAFGYPAIQDQYGNTDSSWSNMSVTNNIVSLAETTPPITTNLYAWFNAQDLDLTGSDIDTLNDRTGNNRDFIGDLGRIQPVKTTLGGYDVIHLVDTGSFLAAKSLTDFNFDDDFTVFYAIRPDLDTNLCYLLAKRDPSTSTNRNYQLQIATNGTLQNTYWPSGSQQVLATGSSAVTSDTDQVITMFRTDGDQGGFVNASEELTGTLSSPFNNSTERATIGILNEDNTIKSNLYIYEIVVYNAALSSGDITTMINYLNTKYGF